MSRRTIGLLLIGLGIIAVAWMVVGGLVNTFSRLATIPEQMVIVREPGQSLRFEPASPPVIERIVPREDLGRELGREMGRRLEGLQERIEEIERIEVVPPPEVRWTSPRAQWNFSLPMLGPYIGSLIRGLLNLVAIVLILAGVGLVLWRRSQPAEKGPKES